MEALSKEGEAGRNKLNQYTNYLTIPLACCRPSASHRCWPHARPVGPVLTSSGLPQYPLATVSIMLTLTAGTMLAMWLGQMITEQGIGNGVSIIIFGGIIAGMPQNIQQTVRTGRRPATADLPDRDRADGGRDRGRQEGQRRIPVQYGKRVRAMRGNRLMVVGGQSTHVPLRVNSAGMIPLIFASQHADLPEHDRQLLRQLDDGLGGSRSPTSSTGCSARSTTLYWILYFLLVIGVHLLLHRCGVPAAEPAGDAAEAGRLHPGHPARPEHRALPEQGAVPHHAGRRLFLGLVAILPWLVHLLFGGGAASRAASSTLLISSTGLLIVVGVVLDTMKQLEAQLLMRHYEGFIRR